MENFSYPDILAILKKKDWSGYPELRIAILRNIMLEPLEAYLRFYAMKMGFRAEVRFGDYDTVFQDAVGGNSLLLNEQTNCVLLFTRLESLHWDLARNFTALAPEAVKTELDTIEGQIAAILGGIRRQTNAMILWHGFELPSCPAYGIWDTQTETGQMATIHELNNRLRSALHKSTNAYFVDLNLCLNRVGARHFYDNRYWHIGRAPYSRLALQEIAFENHKFLRALKGKNKKCLVLDCDNTLWGGIIGEDGLSGIKLGKSYPGSCYYEFQQEIVNLFHRGVIIALCSKNNEADVWEVFEKHPDMALKKEHLAAVRINWQDKATNLQSIALDLNIGLDSIVYLDDSAFEINLVRQLLPEVEALHLPPAQNVSFRDILAACGFFDTLTISDEDRQRGRMYQAEEKRRKLQTQVATLEEYLRSLEMEVEIGPADEFSIPRLAQLTQKTNQFNLTTRRYNDADIEAFKDNPSADVLLLKVSDRFGDSGIVGSCILQYNGGTAVIDTLLLSCRALGRGLEMLLLREALRQAQQRECTTIIGEYHATPKNSQTEFFYKEHGFLEINNQEHQPGRRFRFDFISEIKEPPDYFKTIRRDGLAKII